MEDKERLLVVDDDAGFLQVARAILRTKGYEVETVSSAGEAIARVKDRFYNMAILDISLPDMEGTELLSVLLEMRPDMMAIMLTGHSSAQNAIKSLNLGAFGYLEKPVAPEHLLSVIARGMEKQRLVFENRRLVEELERRSHEANILLEVSQGVSQSLDLKEIIDSALGKVVESMGVDAGYVYLLEGGRLVPRGYCGFNPEVDSEVRWVEIEKSIINRVSSQAEPIIINNIDDNVTGDTESGLLCLVRTGYRSYAGVPLMMAGESIGVMGVATCSERYFNSGEVNLLVAISREISIAVRNAQLYEEASSARSLKELDILRTELLANVSHELRTPLSAIKGFSSALLQPDVHFDKRTLREFLQTIDMEADKLNRLIEDLLVMSRLDAGALEVTKETRGLSEVVASIRDNLCNLTAKHRFQIIIPDDLPPVAVDARMGEVFTNLVENAVRYSPEGTQIMLEAGLNGKGFIVSVSDEGIGIPEDLQGKVFERFYQVADPVVGHTPGTGLGLSICRGIVEAHQGKIWVESEPGKGSKFSFSLPIN